MSAPGTSQPVRVEGAPVLAIVHFTRSVGLLAATATVLLLAAGAVLLARIDLAILAMPLLVALAREHRHGAEIPVSARAELALAEPVDGRIRYALAITPPPGVDAVLVRCTVLGGEPRELVLAGGATATAEGWIPVLHSGPQEMIRVDHRFLGADAAELSAPQPPLVARRVVAPVAAPIRVLPLPRRLQGLVGTHESIRAGDGGEFRDVHLYHPGDRLRRIDWRATARHGGAAAELYVRRTNGLADATALIVLDSRDDVGEQVAEWERGRAAEQGSSALDVAREAAVSLATAYIQAGDRVGFQDLSSRQRMIPHAAGSRHLARLLRAVEATEATTVPLRRRRPPVVPSGALVYLLSSLLDDQPARMALHWRGAGHRVIVVDVLPAPRFANASPQDRVAHRILMMERRDRIRTIRGAGVEILRWPDDAGALPRPARLELLDRAGRASTRGRAR